MVKKLFAAMILAFTLIVAGQTSTAEAGEVYVGTYSDGDAVYLLTETIYRRVSRYFECTVRAGRSYIDYQFWFVGNDNWDYSNSEGYSGHVYDGSSPVAANICNYLRNRR